MDPSEGTVSNLDLHETLDCEGVIETLTSKTRQSRFVSGINPLESGFGEKRMINEFQQGERSGVVEEPENAKSQSQFRPKLHADFGEVKNVDTERRPDHAVLKAKRSSPF